jgi:hypothetical protein
MQFLRSIPRIAVMNMPSAPSPSRMNLRRLIIAGGFAVAIAAAPAVGAFATPAPTATPLADCNAGEEPDQFTSTCTPFLVPLSPQGFTATAANPDIPEVDGVPCLGGRSSASCIGLAEDQGGPQPVPKVTISSSP